MILARSLLFFVVFVAWTIILGIVYLPLLLAPPAWVRAAARFWLRGGLFLLKAICGLGWRVVGDLPSGPVLVASKHQSTLETFVLRLLLPNSAVILKQELLRIPIFGWYLGKSGVVAIDRSAGIKALKDMVKGAEAAVAQGRPILIFPEGTRSTVGQAGEYHSGVAMLYQSLGVDCVPVALNSGLFWGRGSFGKRPGTATIQFLPAISPGLNRKDFMARLQADIETASNQLADNGTACG